MPLDDLSPMPRYLQIAQIIRARIEQGELPEGAAIPSRLQLQQEYGVARDTAAKALRVLVDEGLVVVVPGLGARVTRRGLAGEGLAAYAAEQDPRQQADGNRGQHPGSQIGQAALNPVPVNHDLPLGNPRMGRLPGGQFPAPGHAGMLPLLLSPVLRGRSEEHTSELQS